MADDFVYVHRLKLIDSDRVYYERDTVIIRFIADVPGPLATGAYRFNNMGATIIPLMLTSWSLRSCLAWVCIQSRGKSIYIPPLLGPDWKNGTVNGYDSVWVSVASKLRLPSQNIGQ